MMRIYLNLFGGVAGDMLIAGLLDAGAPPESLQAILGALPAEEVQASWEKQVRRGISGHYFSVQITEGHRHRHLADVLPILQQLPLTQRAHRWAVAAFQALAEAEGKAHNCSAQEVHFHEVGAMDAILDISGACALMDALDPSEIFCSPIPVGHGTVHCAHGAMPIPAPATRYLLEGYPSCGFDLEGECATPTGVALLRAWEVDCSTRGAAVCAGVGYGLGTRDPEDYPNVLRVELETAALEQECVVELRSLVDDQSGEIVGHALEDLRSLGAKEAYVLPAATKKGRPAFEVIVQVDAVQQSKMEQRMFRLLGTLGIRATVLQRSRQLRGVEEKEGLPWKCAAAVEGEAMQNLKPEFESLVQRAASEGKTPREFLLEWTSDS
ncbi:MAG: LarC family nickel insertion protein [Planctomycetota bacterium]